MANQSVNIIPETGFLRLQQIIGDRKAGIPGLIPVCRSHWYQKVKTGEFPQPVKLGSRASAWRVEDIKKLIEELGS